MEGANRDGREECEYGSASRGTTPDNASQQSPGSPGVSGVEGEDDVAAPEGVQGDDLENQSPGSPSSGEDCGGDEAEARVNKGDDTGHGRATPLLRS